MDPVANPYEPGAGRRPPELAGRQEVLERFDVLRRRLEQGRTDRGVMLTGLRGVGKTVLLNEFRADAIRHDWIVAKVEAGGGQGFRSLVAEALQAGLYTVSRKHGRSKRFQRALAVFKSFSLQVAPDGGLAVGVEVAPEEGRANTGDLGLDLTDVFVELGEAVAELGVGALLLVDEMQDLAISDLAAIAVASHESGQMRVPMIVVGAGLPNLPVVLTEAKSYAERLYEYVGIGPLDSAAAAAALLVPAKEVGVTWKQKAVEAVMAAAAGYPYFLQVFGHAVWDVASQSAINEQDARLGIARGRRELDASFFGIRWERATPAQRAYLRALSETGGEHATREAIAARAGRRPGDLSVARQELIRKGLLYAPDRGTVAFTVPGMAEFVRRQPAP
jgi:hypothetical protein